ncbi:MAG: PTS sugar transporter subunit IIC [Ruminococcaceae bacterium]|nr:PTS sugar transporter subunit IIC [Oscillospiraceae bacterium]
MGKVKAFFDRKQINPSAKLYFVDAMGMMALGLFSTLLIGTIFGTLGEKFGIDFLSEIAAIAKNGSVAGAAIGVAIAYALKAPPLVLFSSAVTGAAGYILGASITTSSGVISYTAGPAGSFFVVLVACELGKIVSKETKIDILVTPTVTILSGFALAKLICPAIAYVMYYLGYFINTTTEMHPFFMGIIVATVVGIILTLPISSAAICAMIGITGLAGGAATAGCCAQMVGFAVISYRENGVGGLVAQGLGTSMLQMGNICKKPQIWIAPTLASAICGPIATVLFKLECTGLSAGMGTCGMVGPIGILSDMGGDAMTWIGIIVTCIVAPAILSFIINEILRAVGLVKTGDMQLSL